MLSFPNAKINLGLHILNKREDGYHHIETCLYSIPLCDALEMIPSGSFSFSSSGLNINGARENNLCVKAFQLLKEKYAIPNVKIHLHKVIPMGAGLGGGSADGAFTLRMLNELFELHIGKEQLRQLAAHLGSDCPFFLENQPVIASGTGTEMRPFEISLQGKYLVLYLPDIGVSTREAYEGARPRIPVQPITAILSKEIFSWKSTLVNDFELSIFSKYPELARIKNTFYKEGALYAAMSGSGSTVFGIFEKKPVVKGDQMKIIQL